MLFTYSCIIFNKTSGIMDFPGSDGKASAYNARDPGSIPGLGRSPGEGNGNPLQYSCLENPTDGGTWQATVHGFAKNRTQMSGFTLSLTLYMCQFQSPNSSHSPYPRHAHTSVFYICVSIPALPIGSAIPFFQIPRGALIYNICCSLSDSLCVTVSRFNHSLYKGTNFIPFMAE